MSRIEINQGASADQPKFKSEGEFKGKHGADGFVEKASFFARIFGYYVKVGEHYLNPKSLANYTNAENKKKPGQEGTPVLKPRWIGGTPNKDIKAAFLRLFPKSGAPSQTANNPPTPLQQQPSPAQPKPSLSDQLDTALKKAGDTIPVIQPNSSKTTVQSFQEAQSQQRSSVQTNPFATAPGKPKSTSSDQPGMSLSDMLKAALKDETIPVIQPGPRTTVQPLADELTSPSKATAAPLKNEGPKQTDADKKTEKNLHTAFDAADKQTGGLFREFAQNFASPFIKNFDADTDKNKTTEKKYHDAFDAADKETGGNFRKIAGELLESKMNSQASSPLKYSDSPIAWAVSYDMSRIGLIYTDSELRGELRTALNNPEFEETFRNDLQALLNSIPYQVPGPDRFPDPTKCTAENWTDEMERVKQEIVNVIVNSVKNDNPNLSVSVHSPELVHFGKPESTAYFQELMRRKIINPAVGISGPRDY